MHAVLTQFNTGSEVRLINSIGDSITEARDPLAQANSVITGFGVRPVADAAAARLVAQALAEYAYKNAEFVVDKAIPYVENRVEKLIARSPWGHEVKTVKLEALQSGDSVVAATPVSDKKAAALAIFNEFNGKINAHQITLKIAEMLGISVGNASYYVNRVFKKK